jgi:hypothetical protein
MLNENRDAEINQIVTELTIKHKFNDVVLYLKRENYK